MIQLFSKWTTALLHFIEFFILSFMLGVAFRHNSNKFLSKHAFILALVISGIYGILDEFHQAFVPGRFATISDALVDIIGALFAQIFRNLLKRKKSINKFI
jgi:VanZ family protein